MFRLRQGDCRIGQRGGIEECGHWVFEEKTVSIRQQLDSFWERHG
jgi:pimeloyl-ACP methyl ester carboxylesterase